LNELSSKYSTKSKKLSLQRQMYTKHDSDYSFRENATRLRGVVMTGVFTRRSLWIYWS